MFSPQMFVSHWKAPFEYKSISIMSKEHGKCKFIHRQPYYFYWWRIQNTSLSHHTSYISEKQICLMQFCSQNKYLENTMHNMEDGIILGDSGYECRNFLLIPYLNSLDGAQERYNSSRCKTRNARRGSRIFSRGVRFYMTSNLTPPPDFFL